MYGPAVSGKCVALSPVSWRLGRCACRAVCEVGGLGAVLRSRKALSFDLSKIV
jgi:hypothetical protein